MKNPFQDFKLGNDQMKESPSERIVRANQVVFDSIVEGYMHLVEEEINDLAWVVEHDRVVKAYGTAVERLRGIQYEQEDIEEFCEALDSSDSIPYRIAGPAGLYLSAMINHSQDTHIKLTLQDYRRAFHFLGYRLPEGKTLTLQGNGGDFLGAGLGGGRLVEEGSAGNWCGAGMIKGEILINGNAGNHTGEWMQGGEIHVTGHISSVSKSISGGRIFRAGKPIAPLGAP
ncbi:hypothetical protein ACFL9U_14825 [Thermodesulfobacteriota bacterium]